MSACTVQWSLSILPSILYFANKSCCLSQAQVGHRTGTATATVPDRETRVTSVASAQLVCVPGGLKGSILLLLLLRFLIQVPKAGHHRCAPELTPNPAVSCLCCAGPAAAKGQKKRLCPQVVAKGHSPVRHRELLVLPVGGERRKLGEEQEERWAWARSSFFGHGDGREAHFLVTVMGEKLVSHWGQGPAEAKLSRRGWRQLTGRHSSKDTTCRPSSS